MEVLEYGSLPVTTVSSHAQTNDLGIETIPSPDGANQ